MTLTFTGGAGRFTWRISGLSKNFTTGNGYVRAGITKDRFTVGGVGSISGIIDYKNATSSGSTTVSKSLAYTPGIYNFWGFTETAQGGYWPAGAGTVVVESAFQRFNWTWAGLERNGEKIAGIKKTAGLGVCVTADEWNELVGLVNDVLGTSIQTVSQGASISETRVNQVANALHVTPARAGRPLEADFFNSLREAYNNLE